MATDLPRSNCICRSGRLSKSRLSKIIAPLGICASSGSKPMIASEVSDLPLPDSPAMHRVFPGQSAKLTSSTTRCVPNWIDRRSTESSGAGNRTADITLLIKHAVGKIERHHPVRPIDDFADAQIAAHGAEHIGLFRRHPFVRGTAHRWYSLPRRGRRSSGQANAGEGAVAVPIQMLGHWARVAKRGVFSGISLTTSSFTTTSIALSIAVPQTSPSPCARRCHQ